MERGIRSVVVFVLLGSFTGSAAQLPPEIMVDLYLLRSDRLLEAKDHEGALGLMGQILALQKEHDLRLPEEFHFKYARVALSAGSIEAALESVSRYLVAAGREGEYYREALELLDEAEQVQAMSGQYPAQAEALMAKKDYGAARQVLKKIVALQDKYNLALPGQALEWLDEAERQIRSITPQMVEIQAGRFRMGCVSGKDCYDGRRYPNREYPVHEVRVGTFELSKYEVTFEEYDRFTAATGRELATDGGWGRGRRPVINVSWEDAVAYTAWLSEATGERYRLPSEAEWEYAARAGSVTKHSWGNEVGHNRANCSGCGSQWDGDKTAPVGSFGPNVWGLHDMHGNVCEWVQDCWNESYQGAPTDGSAWESGDCSQRVVRGGGWGDEPRNIRSANRQWLTISLGGGRYLGFRVARTITP